MGCRGVFRLIRWSGQIRTKFHVHCATWDTFRKFEAVTYAAVTVFGRSFQSVLLAPDYLCEGPTTPKGQVPPVWPVPLSLATTDGIISFSLPRVTEMFHFTLYRRTGL